MSGAVGERQRERLLALGAAVFAGTLIAAAREIEDSMLSDAVGAGGVPQGVGIAMAVAAVALFAKSFSAGTTKTTEAAQAESSDVNVNVNVNDNGNGNDRSNRAAMDWQAVAIRTAGLVAILLAYGLLLPVLGYPLTVSLLVLACGWLAGAPLKMPLLLFAALSGPLLWAMFDWALQVRMPVGSLWG